MPKTPETVKLNQKVIDKCITAHNNYRKRHGVPEIKHNEDISRMAQNFANYLAENNKFEHSNIKNRTVEGLGSCGENIAGTFGKDPGIDATSMWYKELKSYDFKKHGFSMKSGHFTAVVWRSSTDIGVGAAMNGKNMWVVVANYYPPGNVQGVFDENVFPLLPEIKRKSNGQSNRNSSRTCAIL